MVTWDESKRQLTIRSHGLDFLGCEVVWDGPVLAQEDDREPYGEQGVNLIGFLRGDIVFMTYTERGSDFHVISLRRATSHEIKAFTRWVSGQS